MSRPHRRLPQPKAMIVAPQPEAVEAGADVLRQGGNAVDAVLACAFTQGVVDPAMCGIGGIGTMHIHDPKSQRSVVYNGLSTCPSACTPDMWLGDFVRECSDGYGFVIKGAVNELGHRAVAVPGVLRVFEAAHKEFGSRAWKSLFGPAIAIANDGWAIRPHVATMFTMDETPYGRRNMIDKLALTPDGRRLYVGADGQPKRIGAMVHNPDLARSLGTVAEGGAEAFYSGELGQKIVADMRANGGLISADDLTGYRLRVGAPIMIRFRGYDLALTDPPTGGVVIGEMLRILERFDLAALGHNSPGYIRIVAEAMKIAGLDKDRHIGDPDFVSPPIERLLSDAYADDCAARIKRGEKASLVLAGSDSKDTTHVSCIDQNGLTVSLTHTLGVPSGVIPQGTGFMLNGAMNWYDPRPGRALSLAPGKRRYSSMSPTIVFKDGKPVLSIGAPGGAWITVAILQVLLNIFEFGMGVQEAVSAPRFSATSNTIDVSNRIPRATQKALEAMGYPVKRSPVSYAFAGVHAIGCFDGVLEGGADPQRDGYAAGVV